MDVSADEKQRIREKIEKLKQSKFKQQTLPAWRPVPTAMSTMFTFSIFSVIFLAIGVVLYVMSDQIVESVVRYDDIEECRKLLKEENRDAGETCKVDLPFPEMTEDIKGPIYVYYQLDNFYQNHRRYVKSRNNDQLAGNYKTAQELLTTCDPIIKVSDLWENQKYPYSQRNIDKSEKKQLDPDDPAIPCGLVAKSFFNDTFQLFKKNPDGSGNDTPITIKEDQIAWTSDKQYKFENLKNPSLGGSDKWEDLQWLDMKDGKYYSNLLISLIFFKNLQNTLSFG